MKKVFNINFIGSLLLVAIVCSIIVLFVFSNGNFIAHPQF